MRSCLENPLGRPHPDYGRSQLGNRKSGARTKSLPKVRALATQTNDR
jgi:hypothetical protein